MENMLDLMVVVMSRMQSRGERMTKGCWGGHGGVPWWRGSGRERAARPPEQPPRVELKSVTKTITL